MGCIPEYWQVATPPFLASVNTTACAPTIPPISLLCGAAKAVCSVKEDPAAARKKAEAEEEARRAAARAHGTQVTVAAFTAWKAKVGSISHACKGR